MRDASDKRLRARFRSWREFTRDLRTKAALARRIPTYFEVEQRGELARLAPHTNAR